MADLAGAVLVTLLSVSLGAVLAGLPNRESSRQVRKFQQQLADDNKRYLNIILANGDLGTFHTLENLGKPSPTGTAATDQAEWTLFQERAGEEEFGYVDALHLPEFPIGPTVRDPDPV